MLKPIENELKELGIEKIILVSATDYMSIKGQLSYLKDVINYNELKNARNNENISKYRALTDKFFKDK